MNWLNSFNKEKSSIADLGREIYRGSFVFAEEMKEYFIDPTEEERLETQMYVTFEFMYLLMHMTNRIAFEKLGDQRRIKLQEELGILILKPMMENFVGHWPESLKEKVLMDMYDKLNEAEIEYSKCKPTTDIAPLFTKNVTESCGQSENDEMITQINNRFLAIFENMTLEELVDAVEKEL